MATRLAARARALASSFGAAAPLWESVNALAARPGMINMGRARRDRERTRCRTLPHPHIHKRMD
jgi:hypothetical protein